MKNLLKNLLKKNNLVLIIICLLAIAIRFYNFPNRVTFWSEQARSLIVSGNYVKEKFSLLGQEYFRQDSNAHVIYSGALFNYSLVPLQLIFDYDPIPITGYFAILNIATGLVVFWTVKKMFGEKMAFLSMVIFLFNDYMVYHSFFIWNYNYLPLIGILSFYLTHEFLTKRKKINIFLIGLLSGVGISLQILFLPIALVILVINIWKSKRKLLDIFIFGIGIIIGNLPMIAFEVRHDFYQLITIFQYFIDTLKGTSDAKFTYYYLLPFWPVFSIIGAWLLIKLSQINELYIKFILLAYLLLNITSSKINLERPTGMPNGLSVKDIALVSNKISVESKTEYNVASVLDFDKRAYVLRYYLQFVDNKNPQGVTDYSSTKLLYVLSQTGYNFVKSDIWEVKSGGLTKVSKLTDVGQGYSIYKLEK